MRTHVQACVRWSKYTTAQNGSICLVGVLYAGPSQNIRFLETKPNAIEHQLGLEVTRSNLDKLKDAVSYAVFNSKIFCLYILMADN